MQKAKPELEDSQQRLQTRNWVFNNQLKLNKLM